MHRVNSGFTLLAPVKAEHVEAVSELLARLDEDPARLCFADSETTFFATITVIPAQAYKDEPLPRWSCSRPATAVQHART